MTWFFLNVQCHKYVDECISIQVIGESVYGKKIMNIKKMDACKTESNPLTKSYIRGWKIIDYVFNVQHSINW